MKSPAHPTVPAEAWCPLGRRYRDAVAGSTEASDNFHLAMFLAIVGILLGRSVCFTMSRVLYPNFYVALTGQSSRARKGSAMGFGQALLRHVLHREKQSEICTVYGVGSQQGFLDAAIAHQQRSQADSVTAVLCYEELRQLIETMNQSGPGNITSLISTAFDCPDVLELATRGHGDSARRPFTSVIGGASPDWLDKIKREDLRGGIGNRFLWIHGERKEPIPNPPPPDPHYWKPLIAELRRVRSYWSKQKSPAEFRRTPEADKLWNDFYRRINRWQHEDELVSELSNRMEVHTAKIALIYAALERSPGIIEVKHLQPAIAFADFLLASLYTIFSNYGLSQIAKDEQRLFRLIREAGPQGLPRRTLQQRARPMDAETFSRRLKWMLAEQMILEEPRNRSLWLRANHDEEEEPGGEDSSRHREAAKATEPAEADPYTRAFRKRLQTV